MSNREDHRGHREEEKTEEEGTSIDSIERFLKERTNRSAGKSLMPNTEERQGETVFATSCWSALPQGRGKKKGDLTHLEKKEKEGMAGTIPSEKDGVGFTLAMNR